MPEDELKIAIARAASALLRARRDFMDALVKRVDTDPAQYRMEEAIENLARLVARYEVLHPEPQ